MYSLVHYRKRMGKKRCKLNGNASFSLEVQITPAAHWKAQLVLRPTATVKAEWLARLGLNQAQTQQHQAVSSLPYSHPRSVLLFPNYTVNSHPTVNSASNGRLHRSVYKITSWAPAHFLTAQIASHIEERTIWEEKKMLAYLIGAFSKTDYGRD